MMEMEIRWSVFLASFLGIIFLRTFEEEFLASAARNVIEWKTTSFLYNFFFFGLTYIFIWIFLAFFLRIRFKKLAGIILAGMWLTVLPPLFDMLKTGGSVYWSFYSLNSLAEMWGQFITLFGKLPPGIVYFGTRIVFISTIIFASGFVFVKTRSIFKAMFGGFATYVIIFMMGTFPSWVTFGYYFLEGSKKITEVKSVDAIQFLGYPYQMFGTSGYGSQFSFASNLNIIYYLLFFVVMTSLFFAVNRRNSWEVVKNIRFPQVAYHFGLFFIGMGLGFWAYPQNMNLNLFSFLAVLTLLASIFMAWKASVVVNDLFDTEIDKLTNQKRPLPKQIFSKVEYVDLGIIFFFLSLLGGAVISTRFAIMLLVYQILAWFYSAAPYRLKRFPIIATFFSSLASFMVVVMGYSLFSGDENMLLFPWRVAILLIVSLTLSLPIKDFKDIEGDRRDGVRTIPVIFGEIIGRTVVGSGIFISFMLSVFILNEKRLFWWAVLFGSLAFLSMTNKKIKTRHLIWWVLGIVALYAMIMLKVLFF